MDGQAVHPSESVADIGVRDRLLGLDEALEAQRQLVMDQDEGEGVVQWLRLDLLEGESHDEKRGRDADVWSVETLGGANEGWYHDRQVAVVQERVCQQLVRRLVCRALFKQLVDELDRILQVLYQVIKFVEIYAPFGGR